MTLSPRSISSLRSICISSTDISLSPRLGAVTVVVDDVVVVEVEVGAGEAEATACETKATEQMIDWILILRIWKTRFGSVSLARTNSGYKKIG